MEKKKVRRCATSERTLSLVLCMPSEGNATVILRIATVSWHKWEMKMHLNNERKKETKRARCGILFILASQPRCFRSGFRFHFLLFGSFIQVICPFLFSRVCLLISVYLYVCSMFSWFSVIFHCIIFILFSGCYCCSFAIFRSQHSVIICCYITLHYNSSNSIP